MRERIKKEKGIEEEGKRDGSISGCHYRYWVEPFIGLQSSIPLLSLKKGNEDQLNGVVIMVIHNSQS